MTPKDESMGDEPGTVWRALGKIEALCDRNVASAERLEQRMQHVVPALEKMQGVLVDVQTKLTEIEIGQKDHEDRLSSVEELISTTKAFRGRLSSVGDDSSHPGVKESIRVMATATERVATINESQSEMLREQTTLMTDMRRTITHLQKFALVGAIAAGALAGTVGAVFNALKPQTVKVEAPPAGVVEQWKAPQGAK